MCGRFTRLYSWREIHDFLDLEFEAPLIDLGPSYNVAPTQDSYILHAEDHDGFTFEAARWGLIPFWAKDKSIGNRLINARGETAAEKPSFRAAWKRRRCVVPLSGFYEWQKIEGETVKQPWYIHSTEGPAILAAGLYENWSGDEGEIRSFTIITIGANAFMKRLHDRMPVMLDVEGAKEWLTGEADAGLIAPAAEDALAAYPVSRTVNSPRNNEPSLVEPVDPAA